MKKYMNPEVESISLQAFEMINEEDPGGGFVNPSNQSDDDL